ncbi:MAG TPA: hypothetical protein VM582_01085 [Candidatus Thermoplasmatota archaeon]|nr:hypothetical protein [Candidatus Thermoplasmatota archaeon]
MPARASSWACLALALAALATAQAAAQAPAGCDEERWSIGPVHVARDHFSFPWIYLESNGIEGLQRGGSNLFGDPDPCGQDELPPDTAIV